MYQRLATATSSLARVLQHVSDELQQLAEEAAPAAAPSSSSPPPPPISTDECRRPDIALSANAKATQHLTPRTEVQDVCDWLRATGLSSWLPYHTSSRGQHWLTSVWMPPESESAYHSLSFSVGSSSTVLSEAEKALANAAAEQLGLPRRFWWPVSVQKATYHASEASPLLSTTSAPANTEMLWPTAMRTTTGAVAPRPAKFSPLALAATPLPSLCSVANAGQVFASAPRVASLSPSSTSTAAAAAGGGDGGEGGGGALYSTTLEAYMVLLLTARTQALTRRAGQHNAFAGPEAAGRLPDTLVLYASDQADPLLLRAAQLIGLRHLRVLQTVAGDREVPHTASSSAPVEEEGGAVHHHNYTLDVTRLQARLVEDVASGLYPVMVVGTFGSGLSGAADPVAAMGDFCQRLGVWLHLDARHGGTALLAAPTNAETAAGASHDSTTTAQEGRMAALADEFRNAALMADSIVVPAGQSALPYAVVDGPSGTSTSCLAGAALLFVSNMRKVAWSVQSLGESRQATFNQLVSPGVSDTDVLRVSPLAHSCVWLASLAVATRQSDASSIRDRAAHNTHARPALSARQDSVNAASSRRQGSPRASSSLPPMSSFHAHRARQVARHQRFTSAVLQAVRRDGRFDASLDASLFGMVHLRWLTAADEATSELARVWAKLVEAPPPQCATAVQDEEEPRLDSEKSFNSVKGGTLQRASHRIPPVQVRVGVVQLQRRLWVTLSFGELPAVLTEEEENASAHEIDSDADALMKSAIRFVVSTLDVAARAVKPEGRS